MKKLILFLIAATMTLTGFAAGTGDGSSRANAIEFDWTNGHTQAAGTVSWYVVRFGDRLTEVDDPNIALYLTNMSSSLAELDVTAVLANEEESRNYTVAGNATRIWNTSASMLVKMGYTEMFVKLKTNQQVFFTINLYEGTFADEACLKATDYKPYCDGKTYNLTKGTRWYSIDLNALREANQGLEITYSANATSRIVSMISTDCPSTGLSGLKGSVPAKRTRVHEISPALIQSMTESTLYLKVENSRDVSFTVKTIQGLTEDVTFNNITEVTLPTDVYTIGKEGKTFVITREELLKGKKQEPQLTLNNEDNTTNPAYVKVEIAFNSEKVDELKTKNVIEKNDTVIAGESGYMDFARNMIESLNAENCKYVYVRITPNQSIKASARLKHLREGNACAAAQSVNWNEVIYQDVEVDEENSTVWYAINVKEPKENKQDLTIVVTNRGDASADVLAELAFECPYVDLQTVSRKIEAGKSVSKKINYSSVAMLGAADVIYVGVTTTQPIKVEVVPSEAKKKDASEITCVLKDAVPFNFEEGNRQDAGVTVWYSVPAANLINADYIPEVLITNEGNAALTIKGELSMSCPDEYDNQARSLTIGANGTYTKEIATDLLKKLGKDDVVYIKLNGNQPFNFRLNKKVENEGASCAKAIPFNWTSGHNQDADVTLWYVIDLTEIQNTKGKKVHVVLKNLTGKEATIDAALSSDCPVSAPQQQAVKLTANQVREKDIARSSFTAFGEKVYIRLQGTQKFHFEASIQDADPFTPISFTATPVKYNTLTDKVADDAWYSINLDRLCDNDSTARLMFINGAAAQSVKASIAYENPVTEEMQTTTRSFAANQTMSKVIERSMYEQLCAKGIKTVYMRVEGPQDYQFRVDIIDPNNGQDCQHAVEIKDGKKIPHEAGKTLWYKLNVADIRTSYPHSKLIFSMTNTDGKAGAVKAVAYTDCEGEQLISGSATVGAGAKREKDIKSDALMGLSSAWVYIQITAAQAQELLLQIETLPELETPITACEDSKRFAINTDYNQGINTNVWYRINLKELRENTVGDATLIVTDLSGEENTLTAELAWECPVKYEMTSKSMVLKANDKYTRTFSRDLLYSAEGYDVVYVRVTSEKEMTFRVDMHMNKGDECSNPVEFDWDNGNTNPQGECVWYNVAMVDELGNQLVPADKDLRLTIVNLSDKDVIASADIRFECKERSLGDGQYKFTANETKVKVIDGRLIDQVKPTSIVVNLCTPQSSMYIKAEVIDNETDSVCVVERTLILCDGEDYDDDVTNVLIKRHIDSNDLASLTWDDTVQVRISTILVDSVFRFTVVPMVAATAFDYSTVAEENAIIANEGEKLDYTKFNTFIEDYYKTLTAADSLATFDHIEWEAFDADPEYNDFRPIDQVNALKEDLTMSTQVLLAYTVFTVCDDHRIYDTIPVTVQKGCEDVFDLANATINWPAAVCGQPYDYTVVEKQIQDQLDAAGLTDKVAIYYNDGTGAKQYDGTVKFEKGKTVEFYAEVTSTCDNSTSKTATVNKLVGDADYTTNDKQVNNLPLASEYDGWILIINLKKINEDYDLNLVQGDENEKNVIWYRDGAEIHTGGYYYTLDEKMPAGNYYAVIVIETSSTDECGGKWRTENKVISTKASVGTRKQMINGKLYIVTEDNVMYDAQGQKVQ